MKKLFSKSPSLRGKLPSETKASLTEIKETQSELNKIKEELLKDLSSISNGQKLKKLEEKQKTCDEQLKKTATPSTLKTDIKSAMDFIKQYRFKNLQDFISEKEWENLTLEKMKELNQPDTLFIRAMVAYTTLNEAALFDPQDIKYDLNLDQSPEVVLPAALTIEGAKEKFAKQAIHGNTATVCYEVKMPKDKYPSEYKLVEKNLVLQNPALITVENIKSAYIISSHALKDIGKKIDNPNYKGQDLEQSATLKT